MAPKDFVELENMMDFAIKLKSPVVIRYPRGGEAKEKFKTHSYIQLKKCDVLTLGNDVTILAIGNQVAKAMSVFRKLKEININAEVINARILKPIDKYTDLKYISKTRFIVTIEDNTLVSGLGAEVKELIAEKKMQNVTIKSFGYPDVFVEHGSPDELEKNYKIDEKSIFNYIKGNIRYKKEKNRMQKKGDYKSKEKVLNYVALKK